VYEQVTEEDPDVEHEVYTVLPCLISRICDPETPVVPLEVVTEEPVKVTVPKFAKGTKLFPDEKSSTIHSALVWHSLHHHVSDYRLKGASSYNRVGSYLLVWPEKVLVTVFPVVKFWMTALPALVLVAVTVILIWSPGLTVIPVKSYA
jgi:hypothetical protein